MRRALTMLVLSAITIALAAPGLAVAKTEASAWEIVDVTLHNEQGSSVLLISGKLADSVKLPATVKLSAPAGGQLQWAGEILDGPAENDPEVETTVEKAGDSDVYTFTLTQSRIGQIEVIEPSVLRFDGNQYQAALSWTAPVAVDKLRLNILVPPNGEVVSSDEGLTTIPGPNGFTYLRRTAEGVKPGDTAQAKVAFALGAAPAAGGGAAQSNTGVPAAILGVGFALLVVVVVMGVVAKSRARRAATEEYELIDDPADDGILAAIADSDDDGVLSATDDTGGADGNRSVAADVGYPAQEARFDDSDDPLNDLIDEEPAAPPARKLKIVPVVVIAALVFAGAFAVSAGSRSVASGGTVSMNFQPGDACTSSTFSLAGGGNLEKDAQAVLETLRQVPGVNYATLDTAAGTISVAYCGSSASAEQIQAALTTSGYAPTYVGDAAPTSAPQ